MYLVNLKLKRLQNFGLKYLKIRWICSSIIIILTIILILIPLFLILFTLADQAFEFYLYLQKQYQIGLINEVLQNDLIVNILSYINITEAEILQQIVDVLSKTSLMIFSNLTKILSFSLKFIINIFFMLLIMFFLFKDGEKLSEMFYNALPFPKRLHCSFEVGEIRFDNVCNILEIGNDVSPAPS